jgi:transmembrane sensor
VQPPKAPAPPGACDEQPRVTQDIAAEAAVWLARLHGPATSRAMQRACLAWQARSAAHRLAFERCTDTWQDVAGVQRDHIPAAPSEGRRLRPSGRRLALAVAALGCVSVGAVLLLWPTDTYSTGVGERRVIVLADGSRVTLNTATEVRVKLTDLRRLVTVARGEALFEVAKDASRPFVVQVAGTEVVATGTEFVVRYSPDAQADEALAVTLVEGQVVVQRVDGRAGRSPAVPLVMAPGQRVRIGPASTGDAVRIDRPLMDQTLAWQRGEVLFDDVALVDAVAEMNRYSATQITIETQALQQLRVGGAYRTGDNVGFAHALAQLYGLVVRARGDRLELVAK